MTQDIRGQLSALRRDIEQAKNEAERAAARAKTTLGLLAQIGKLNASMAEAEGHLVDGPETTECHALAHAIRASTETSREAARLAGQLADEAVKLTSEMRDEPFGTQMDLDDMAMQAETAAWFAMQDSNSANEWNPMEDIEDFKIPPDPRREGSIFDEPEDEMSDD